MPPEPWLVAGALLLVVLTVAATVAARRWWDRWLGRWRNAKGKRKERGAARLLEQAGCKIIETQWTARAHVLVDGERHETTIYADYLVERDGRRLVVEVKSGALRAATRQSTRRQLLEYLCVYDVDGALLVDAADRTIVEIGFEHGQGQG